MTITNQNILSLIPQRPPFIMVDRLISFDGKSTCTTLLVTKENILVTNNELSEAGLIENIAQTAAAGAGYLAYQQGKPLLPGYIGAVKNLEIFALPKVNSVIKTEVSIENEIFDVSIIKGKVWCDGCLLAQCEMKIFIQTNN